MPELPEVETTICGIRHFLEGSVIERLIVRDRRLRWPVEAGLENKIRGHLVTNLGRRGKYILVHLDQGGLLVHLGMSGSMRVVSPTDGPEKHDHFDLVSSSGHVVRYRDPRRFGCLIYSEGSPAEHVRLSGLGREPLSDNFDGLVLKQASKGKNVNIKTMLMSGSVVVGVGNIYASEVLHLAGIHPLRKCTGISMVKYVRLAEKIKQVLSEAIAKGGTTLQDFVRADGSPGYFERELRVYGRAGQPCQTCGTSIRNRIISQRSTFYCPKCQN